MSLSRIPVEAPPPRMAALARLPVFFALAGKRALLAGGTSAAAWKAELLSAAGATLDVFATDLSDEMQALADEPPHGAIVVHRTRMGAAGFRRRRDCGRRLRRRGRGGALCRRRARGGRAGQRHRQASVLRFLIRLDRQPFAAGDRHLDRRRGARVRAGDPRQARGDPSARLCRLGGSGAALARRREIVRAVVRGPPEILAALHRARTWPIPIRSRRKPISTLCSLRRATKARPSSTAPSRWSAPAPAIPNCSRCVQCARCNPPT